MKSGYDQFFKKARENAQEPVRKTAGKPRFQMQDRKGKPSISSSMSHSKATTNAELASELRRRLQAAKKPKRRSKISWKLAGLSFLGLVITAGGFLGHDKVEGFVKRLEISMIGTAIAEEKPAPVADKKTDVDAKKETAAAAEAAPKKEFTEEEINHFAKLNERKRELDAREEELNRLETELQAQKAELEKRMQGLEKTRRDISSVLEERVKTDDQKVETLVQMYSNMKPQQAAKIFEEMDEDLAVEIISRMKKKNAAEIMNLIKPEKAKVFAEKFAGYKRT